MGFDRYMGARDFFELVRSSAREAERTREALADMEAREGVRAQSYGSRGTQGGAGDPMSATDVRIDYEARMRRRVERDYAIIDAACEVLFGLDGTCGGLSALMGSEVADCLWWRFCAAATWEEVAAGCGRSERWCRETVDGSPEHRAEARRAGRQAQGAAFDLMDAYGLARVACGLGLAEG